MTQFEDIGEVTGSNLNNIITEFYPFNAKCGILLLILYRLCKILKSIQ